MKLLDVPYMEKDEAKNLGAKWNALQKKWFVPDGIDSSLFEKWFPEPDAEPQAEAFRNSPK